MSRLFASASLAIVASSGACAGLLVQVEITGQVQSNLVFEPPFSLISGVTATFRSCGATLLTRTVVVAVSLRSSLSLTVTVTVYVSPGLPLGLSSR